MDSLTFDSFVHAAGIIPNRTGGLFSTHDFQHNVHIHNSERQRKLKLIPDIKNVSKFYNNHSHKFNKSYSETKLHRPNHIRGLESLKF